MNLKQEMKLGAAIVATAVAVWFGGGANDASAAQMQLEIKLANPYLPAEQPNRTFLKIGLTGFALEDPANRPPVNVAIVLDKSASMAGEGIIRAREAAKWAVDQLSAQDVVSLVTYDSSVRVVVPATRLADKVAFKAQIDAITPGGRTALFAGVSKGAAEVRKFLAADRVNRVVLLSDGKANVGLRAPGDLGELGASLMKEGISVTTIGLGLGFHEDLMERLANKSDGNHLFVEEAAELGSVFKEEFGDVLSVVAQDVELDIRCAPGVRPVRVLGREADIAGGDVSVRLNQVYSKQEKYVLLEVEIAPGGDGKAREVAEVSVAYDNMGTQEADRLTGAAAVRFTAEPAEVKGNVDKEVMVACVTQKATLANRRAVELRDLGQVLAAQELLQNNTTYLKENAALWQSAQLDSYARANDFDARNLVDPKAWNRTRKGMRAYQLSNERQQRLIPNYGQSKDQQGALEQRAGY